MVFVRGQNAGWGPEGEREIGAFSAGSPVLSPLVKAQQLQLPHQDQGSDDL